MAKPGRDAARLVAGARDLARSKMTDKEAREAQEAVEIANGLRCAGCGRRVVRGFSFISIAVRDERPVMRLAACSRDDCGYAALCRAGATYVEQVEYVWLDAAGADAPPAAVIVAQNERMDARRRAAQGAPVDGAGKSVIMPGDPEQGDGDG